ncbi:MAG: type VI secretion system tip protein TssI/VgrG [Pseudomonadota bacterium]
MAVSDILENAKIGIQAWPTSAKVQLVRARVIDGISTVGSIEMEFVSGDLDIKLEDVVGQDFGIELELQDMSMRKFWGTCSHAEFVGVYRGYGLYRAVLRDWFWLMMQSKDCRIFQNMKTTEILKAVFQEIGFSDVTIDVSGEDPEREYCVQYNETDFAFVCRLMEEDGFYYWYEHGDSGAKLKIADSPGAHSPVSGTSDIKFELLHADRTEFADALTSISGTERIVTGKVAKQDYNFETSTADIEGVNSIKKGKHAQTGLEDYTYAGHQADEAGGNRLARVSMEGKAVQHHQLRAMGNARQVEVGRTFKLIEHPRSAMNEEYLVTSAVYDFQVALDEFDFGELLPAFGDKLRTSLDGTEERFNMECRLIPSQEQYRAPQTTPWPHITGVQTAVVTGPSGEEIYCDEYGRVKVQFHWDRDGKKDENTTCWLRVAVPWTAKQYGMIAVPRIGFEVVVQFEDGNPDRPLITGMVYNDQNMPPYPLPAQKNKSGVKTRSTKQGEKVEFNEIFFDDTRGAELFNTQAQRDYAELVKHNQTSEVGNDYKKVTMRFYTDLNWGVRANITGVVQDTFVGGHQTEFTGIVKDETVGFYKAETVGLPRDLGSQVLEGLGAAQSLGGVGLAASNFSDTAAAKVDVSPSAMNTAMTVAVAAFGTGLAAISAKNGARVGKDETIHGNSNLTVTKGVKGVPGDRFVKIEDGDYKESVLKGHRQTGIAEGDYIFGVDKGDVSQTVTEGKWTVKIKKNYETEVEEGDLDLETKKGNVFIASADKISQSAKKAFEISSETNEVKIEAKTKISLTVGANKIEISQSGIKIQGTQVAIKGTGTATFEAPKADVKGTGILIVKGGITKIN